MRFRFGSFEFDSDSGDLWQDGRHVRLRPQPSAVLTYLLERPGQLVKRQDLHRHLWGDRVHVHFDQGLNSCIKQVRRALEMTTPGSAPDFIETLSRRGYRFMGTVARVAQAHAAPVEPIAPVGPVAPVRRLSVPAAPALPSARTSRAEAS